jgi:hypothetical protein
VQQSASSMAPDHHVPRKVFGSQLNINSNRFIYKSCLFKHQHYPPVSKEPVTIAGMCPRCVKRGTTDSYEMHASLGVVEVRSGGVTHALELRVLVWYNQRIIASYSSPPHQARLSGALFGILGSPPVHTRQLTRGRVGQIRDVVSF